MTRALLIVVLGGCQILFPLTPPVPEDAPPGDLDGDGFDDLADNCPAIANADQHDEDGDQVGDVCDNCPHVANGSQDDDGDGDHLGAACDDSAFQECIVLFQPFTAELPADETTLGTWTVIEDAVHQNAMIDNAYRRVDPVRRVNPLIITRATVLRLGPSTAFSNHGVWFSVDEAVDGVPAIGFQAEITNTVTFNPNTAAAIHLSDPPASLGHLVMPPDTNLEADTRTEIRLDFRGVGLSATGTLIESGATETITASGMIGPGFVGLRAVHQEVAFHYVLVIERMLGGCPPRG